MNDDTLGQYERGLTLTLRSRHLVHDKAVRFGGGLPRSLAVWLVDWIDEEAVTGAVCPWAPIDEEAIA